MFAAWTTRHPPDPARPPFRPPSPLAADLPVRAAVFAGAGAGGRWDQMTTAAWVARDANVGHRLAGGNSSWCPESESRTDCQRSLSPQPEVIRAIMLEDSPYMYLPQRPRGASRHRSRGTHLAAGELEPLAAAPWELDRRDGRRHYRLGVSSGTGRVKCVPACLRAVPRRPCLGMQINIHSVSRSDYSWSPLVVTSLRVRRVLVQPEASTAVYDIRRWHR